MHVALCRLQLRCPMFIRMIRSCHSIHNVVDRGVLQAGQATPRSTHYLLSTPRMQACRRLRHWSIPSPIITLCYTPTHASNKCRLKFTSCAFCGRLAAPDFVMKCIESTAVQWPVWKFYVSLTLLHFRTGGCEWCTECQRRHSSRKR